MLTLIGAGTVELPGSNLMQIDDDSKEIREAPQIEFENDDEEEDQEEDLTPDYVNFVKINFNNDNWDDLKNTIRNGGTFNIVHIGDSHLQADIATNVTRQMLQYDFGNGGRGLIAPLRLSGTNEPLDYGFKSDINWSAERFMRPPWNNMGFTGCAIFSEHPQGFIELYTSDKNDWNPFNSATIFHSGEMEIASITDSEGVDMEYETNVTNCSTTISFHGSKNRIHINLVDSGPLTIYGATLKAGHPGLIYNVIGNNGATYQSYNLISEFGYHLAHLRPNLVILSMGCNEAFGRFDELSFINQVDRLVRTIKQDNPNCKILITTPQECHKRQTTYISRKRGRKRRSTTFAVNQNVEPIRRALLNYAKRNHIPTLDIYEAAGGRGSSDRWVADGLFSKDHIHLSVRGYHLIGRILYTALSTALNPGIITEIQQEN